ncbi:MAG: NAD(P)H-dependent oxidoreductase [Bacteroidota bacterium]
MSGSKIVIIQGSSRSQGDTHQFVSYLREKMNCDWVDLKPLTIGHFDYEFGNQGDDFMPLMRRLVQDYDTFIFATPVYWYTMSGIMKVFFDRLSDLLKIDKPLGRQLRGKQMAVLSCASDADLKAGFHMPFVESANYLGMTYLGEVHAWIEEGQIPSALFPKLHQFIEKCYDQ